MIQVEGIFTGGGGTSKDHVPVLGEDFTYTGSCEVIDDSNEVSGVQWRIKFYTSGTLVFAKKQTVDLFLVGGGGNGGAYSAPNAGGGGGGGGYTGTFKQLTIEAQQSYSIVVGGSAGASSALGQSVNGGKSASMDNAAGANGGSGGGGGCGTSNYNGGNGGSDGSKGVPSFGIEGKGQGTTTREFGETGATLYAGGGGGSAYNSSSPAGKGGGGGGGSGTSYGGTAKSGAANTGGGGGGIRDIKNNGAGGSGIAIIRKAKN